MLKGLKDNPIEVVVRQESATNKTLSITLSRSVLEVLGLDEIKKGDVLLQWVDPTTKTIYLKKKVVRSSR